MKSPLFTPDRIHYILRFYLPHWNYEERFAEALRFCRETGTEHVMLFTDAQHIVWNQLTLEEAEYEAGFIARAVTEFGKHGITVGINSSYNMLMSRADHRKHNPYDHWVQFADGTTPYRTPCLLDPKLETYLRDFYTILAKTGASYIYIDDDHRYIFNGQRNTWGCMCDLHLEKFGEHTGQTWTRHTLQNALLSDADTRRKWIQFLGERLDFLAGIMEKAVHAVNPSIRVGMMVPCLHQLPVMGHNVRRMAERFQPDGRFLLRPCIGPYSDRDRMQIMPGLFYMECLAHLFGDEAEYTPEIETTPFTRFSKSMAVVRFHITQGILNRMNNPALSVCGYVGNSPFLEPAFAKMLRENRSFFETVRRHAPKRGTKKGIQLLWKQDSAEKTLENYTDVQDYYWPSFSLHDILTNAGFAITYDESKTKFLAGDTAYALTPEEMRNMLGGNLILDAVAARAFTAAGFADAIGCDVGESIRGFGAEECTDAEFSGPYHGNYIVLKDARIDAVYQLNARAGSRVLTETVDHDRRKISDGMILHTNQYGGKVCVTNYRIAALEYDLRHFLCYQKQHILRRVLAFMDHTEPVFVESPSCCAVQYYENPEETLIAVTNLSYDVTQEITLTFAEPSDLSGASYIGDDGTLQKLEPLILRQTDRSVTFRAELPIFKPFLILCHS